jgi:uncharacterized glyoxalase superfamily protein PhnB
MDAEGAIPMIAYEDGPAAMDWLADAFGFTELTRWTDDSGRLTHGELETGAGLVMLATPTPDYEALVVIGSTASVPRPGHRCRGWSTAFSSTCRT